MVGEYPVVFIAGYCDCCGGFFLSSKVRPENVFVVLFYVTDPQPMALAPSYPFVTRGVYARSFHVACVLRLVCRTKIGYAVICGVPVYVVHTTRREIPVNVKPCQSVSEVELSIYKNLNIAMVFGPHVSCFSPRPSSVPSLLFFRVWFPSKIPSLRVVVEKLANSFGSDVVSEFSHKIKKLTAGGEKPLLAFSRRERVPRSSLARISPLPERSYAYQD